MFDTKQTNEYRQMTVPAEWKDDILSVANNARQRSKRPLLLISSLAACLALLVFTAVMINAFTATPAVTIHVTQPSLVAVARTDAPSVATLTLTADGTIRVSTENSTLLWVDENGNAVSFLEKETTDFATLQWTVSTEIVRFDVNGQPYTLTHNAENGEVTVSPIVPD